MATPTTTKTQTCLRLEFEIYSMLRYNIDPSGVDLYEARDQVEAQLNKAGFEQLGGAGSSTTYLVSDQRLVEALHIVRAYNSQDNNPIVANAVLFEQTED